MPSEAPRKIMATKTPRKEPHLVGDMTRSSRNTVYLERLEAAKGKRLLVDLDVGGRNALETLLEAGYGATQKEVVIRALTDAVAFMTRKP